MNKILLIDKPSSWTSFDAVAKIRGAYSAKEGKRIKVGHAGTLDPFATGLLIILLGDATKNQAEHMKLDKEYEATFTLGYTSDTGDPEGKLTKTNKSCYKKPDKDLILRVLSGFIGEISQIPPKYSAIKVNGERAYKLAREGKEVSISPRKITIYNISLIDYQWPELKINVKCSSGTYIRVLAEDIGKALGCGAYSSALRRTKIGKYDIEKAISIDKIIENIN